MYDDHLSRGWIHGLEEPGWEPLEKFLPTILCGPFMWMHRVELEDDGPDLHAYKHRDTRMYLILDAAANAWESLGSGWHRRMRNADALEPVFDTGWVLNNATDEERAALKLVLDEAWQRGHGDEAKILPSSPACAFRRNPWMPPGGDDL